MDTSRVRLDRCIDTSKSIIYDDLVVFLKRPTVVEPFRVVELCIKREHRSRVLTEFKQVPRSYERANADKKTLRKQILASHIRHGL